MEIYLIRHGETEWNRRRRLQGRSDIPLNDTGLAEARKAERNIRELSFDRIIHSPLLRAKRTAEILRGERSCPIEANRLLTELSFGIGEGIQLYETKRGLPGERLERSEAEERDWREKKELRERLLGFFEEPENYIPVEGAESIAAIKERAASFLEEEILPREGMEERLMLVSHGGMIRAFLSVLLDLSDRDFWNGKVSPNCGATILELQNGKFTLRERRNLVTGEILPL